MSTSDLSGGPTSQGLYEAVKARRNTRRRTKKNENEITYLNITPMLDMMTILLVFLLKSFATSATNVNVANLVLPHSTTKLKVQEAVQLLVTKDEILVDDKPVTGLAPDQTVKDEDQVEGYLVKPLYDALMQKADYFKRIEEFGGSQFEGKVAILADESVAYETVFKVLYTAGRAEFGLFKLFVQKPPS